MNSQQITWPQVAKGLAWFGVALGAVELMAPRTLARMTGLPAKAGLLRAFGAREIGAGIAILAARRAAPGLWARVAGDALDLTALAAALLAPARNVRAGVATASVLGVTVLDVLAARAANRRVGPEKTYLEGLL